MPQLAVFKEADRSNTVRTGKGQLVLVTWMLNVMLLGDLDKSILVES